MKLVIRLFNIFIMAFSLAAAVLLFALPSFSFNSNIAIDVAAFSKFVPQTQYSDKIKVTESLGTDTIQLRIQFSLNVGEIPQVMNGNRDNINDKIISQNIDEMTTLLREPVNLITDFSVRSVIKSTVKSEITKQIDESRKKYGSASTPEEIMDDVGMDDKYFDNFAFELYHSMDEDDATVDSVNDTLYHQIDDALAMAEESGVVDNSGFTAEKKVEIKNNLSKVLTDLKLVQDGGKLRKISHISYYYLALYLKDGMQKKIADPGQLEQKSDEALTDYSDRLLKLYIFTQTPDGFYQGVGYVSLGLFIGLFVFAGIWLLLFVITLIKTFSKKPWTIFGPWYWIIGSLQLVLGLGLTIVGKFVLARIDLTKTGLPLKHIILAPRTYALTTSIIFLASIGFAIVYAILRSIAKKSITE